MHDRFNQRLGMTLADRFDDAGIARCESDAHSWFREIHYGQPDEERRRGDDLEIDHGFDPHASDLSERAGDGDYDDNRLEDKRSDDRFDQADAGVAQDIKRVSPVGTEATDA